MLGSTDGEGIPKYIQLARIIRDRIVQQVYAPGEQIPTEAELGAEHDVSRITVREALNRLVKEGWLVRRQGKGTYVAHQKLLRNVAKVYSFSTDMRRMGLEPRSQVLAVTVEEADAALVERLLLPPASHRVTVIKRVRVANDVPILVETAIVPEYLCQGLADKPLESDSLYRIFAEDYQLVPHHAEETYEAIILGRDDAALLSLDSDTPQPAFAIHRTTYLESGAILEMGSSVGRGDMLTLSITMLAEKADFQRVFDVDLADEKKIDRDHI